MLTDAVQECNLSLRHRGAPKLPEWPDSFPMAPRQPEGTLVNEASRSDGRMATHGADRMPSMTSPISGQCIPVDSALQAVSNGPRLDCGHQRLDSKPLSPTDIDSAASNV